MSQPACHEKFGPEQARVCAHVHMIVHVWYALRQIQIWREFKFGDVLMIRQTAKLKVPAKFSRYTV